ncbi:MAG: GDYXXLXY domain-containing protein [Hyphomicrobiaceae bacterium]
MPPNPQIRVVPDGAPLRAPPALIGLLIAGGLVGLGLTLWIAANWQEFGNVGRFTLVAAFIITAAGLGMISRRARVASALLGVFAIGGLFALFGQTYQSSANAYELFAVWAIVALPWIIAARHDAVWSLWVVIAFTALPLWLNAQGAPGSRPIANTLSAWTIAVAICALLTPWAPLERWIGSARFAFRLAIILALALIVFSAIGAGSGRLLFWIGLVVLSATVVGFAFLKPFSLLLLTAATFGLDVLVIYALAKPMLQGSHFQGGLLLTGLLSAGVMAGSATGILKIATSQEATPAATTMAADGGTKKSIWPVAVLSGLGALLTALPIMAFLGLTFGKDLFQGPITYVAGVAMLAGAVIILRSAGVLSFRQQLAFIALVIGLVLVTFAMFRDTTAALAALGMLIVTAGLAVAVPIRWIAGLLGAVSVGFFVFALVNLLKHTGRSFLSEYHWMLAFLAAAAVGAVGLGKTGDLLSGASPAPRDWLARAHGFVTGWCGGALIMTLVGNPTFLLAHGWSGIHRLAEQSIAFDFSLDIAKAFALILVGGGIVFLLSHGKTWRNLPTLAIFSVIAVLSYVRPPIAGAFAIYAAARATGHYALTYLSGFAIVWLVGSFYYWLGWPLTAKAYLLTCLGVALGGIVLASGHLRTALPKTDGDSPPTRPLAAMALTVISVLATAVIVGSGIRQNEEIIQNGKRIFIALGPADPRSLMRGDYMALNFRVPPLPRSNARLKRYEFPVWASASVDKDDVATIKDYGYEGAKTIAGDIILKIQVRSRRVVIGTNAFFFPEGQASKFSNARFGEFRVGKDGKPILIGLADENRRRIE